MKTFLAQHLSMWGGMFCLAMYVYSEKILFAIGFIALFLINTCISLYKHAEFVVYTQAQREEFEREMEQKHATED